MASIDEAYQLTLYRANKAGYLGSISPDNFNLLFPEAEIKYYNKEYSLYASTEKISDTLSKFKSDPLTITIPGTGQYPSPCDLFHVDAILHNFGGNLTDITRVEADRLGTNLSSSYDAPTAEFPIYTPQKDYIQFYPVTLGDAVLIYLKKPLTSFWAYTLEDDRPVYDPDNSVQPLWYDYDISNIVNLLLADLGINFRDAELENFSDKESKGAI